MTVGKLIRELQLWDRNLEVRIEDNQMANEIKEVVKDEYFYDFESGECFCDKEENTDEKRTIILIKHQ